MCIYVYLAPPNQFTCVFNPQAKISGTITHSNFDHEYILDINMHEHM